MDDLSDLYQEIILSHNKRPRNEGELNPHSHEAEGYNPLCGDRLKIYVRQAGDRGMIEAVTFTGEGCAISRASASIMTTAVAQHSKEEVLRRIARAINLLTSAEEPEIDLDELGDFAALAGVRKFPARVKCATLAWHTLAAALERQERVSTE